jgi:hypothetical protein
MINPDERIIDQIGRSRGAFSHRLGHNLPFEAAAQISA